MVHYIRERELLRRIRQIIAEGPYTLSDFEGVGGSGGAGRLLEQLLGIDANNVSAPDSIEYEIKTTTTSTTLVTLFHKEPGTRRSGLMNELVRRYGWPPTRGSYPPGTLSFRHTASAEPTERGFSVQVEGERVCLRFRAGHVHKQHGDWLRQVRARGRGMPPLPLEWTVDELSRTGSRKLPNCLYVHCEKRAGQVTFTGAVIYRRFLPSRFINGLRRGDVHIDIDARTAGAGLRNHGTKFRVRDSFLGELYEEMEAV